MVTAIRSFHDIGICWIGNKGRPTFDKSFSQVFRLYLLRIDGAISVNILDRLPNVQNAENIAACSNGVTDLPKSLFDLTITLVVGVCG